MHLLEGCCVYIDSCSSVSFLFQGTSTCYIEVWDRPWRQLREFTHIMCQPATAGMGATVGMSAPENTVCIAFVVVLYL